MAILNPDFTPESFLGLSDQGKLERLVYYAGLAPSSHNTQPWLFKLSQDKIEVCPNWRRQLFKSDPKSRELFLSLGAAIANIKIVAQSFGLNFSLSQSPETETVASFKFDSLAATLLDKKSIEGVSGRHCNRDEYEDTAISEQFLLELKEVASRHRVQAFIIAEAQQKARAAKIVADAVESAFLDKGFTEELSHWLKPSLSKYRDGMPGYNVGIPWLLSFVVPWATRHFNMSKQQRKMNEPPLARSAAFVVLGTNEDNKENWLNTGQALEQIWVAAEKQNIKLGVLAAPIEIGDYYKQIQRTLGTAARPQIFFRVGYTNKIPKPSPRLPIKELLIP